MANSSTERMSEALNPVIPGLWELAAYAIAVAVLVWLTLRIRAWFREDDAGTGRNNDLLTDIRELHRQGGLSDEEFRLIKTQLVGGLKEELDRPAAPAKNAEVEVPKQTGP